MIASNLVFIEITGANAQMQWLIALFLPWALFKTWSFSSQSQFSYLLLLVVWNSLAANFNNSLHIATFCSDQTSGYLKFFVVIYLNIKSTSVFNIFILRILLLLLLLCLWFKTLLLIIRWLLLLVINVLIWKLSQMLWLLLLLSAHLVLLLLLITEVLLTRVKYILLLLHLYIFLICLYIACICWWGCTAILSQPFNW